MSSMFKKRGGLAFKPKIPSARPRPVPKARVTEVPQSTEKQDSLGSAEVRRDDSIADSNTARTSQSVDSLPPPKASRDVELELAPGPSIETAKPSDTPQKQSSSRVTRSSVVDTESTGPTRDDREPIGGIASESLSRRRSSRNAQVVNQPEGSIESIAATPNVEASRDTAQRAAQGSPAPIRRDTEAGVSVSLPTPSPAPTTESIQQTKRKKPIQDTETAESSAIEDDAPKVVKRRRSSAQNGEGVKAPPRKRKARPGADSNGQPIKRRARSLTPEDAETQVVDLQKLRMADLTKDLHIGKKFSRHDELRERERQARAKAKLGKINDQANSSRAGSESRGEDGRGNGQDANGESARRPPPAPASGPQFRIVDGQIVVDQNSLVMDRHARAAAAQEGQEIETVEENDFTRLITSSSFLNTSKLKGPNIWTPDETELFYRGLRMFGTDFEMISKMFAGKQRRHIKLKYNREERHCPERVTAAVVGEKTTKIDIEEYKTFTGTNFEPVEVIESEQRKIEESYEAERKRIADEQAEIMRKKREELFAEDDDEVNARKRKGGKKKGKHGVAYDLNGEPIATE